MNTKLKQLLTPPVFESEEDNRVARILYTILFIMPAAFIIFIIDRITVGDNTGIIILLTSFIWLNSSFYFITHKRLKTAIFILALTCLTVVTIFATLGQGIHDISIVAYPGVLIIMSLMLNRKYFIILSFITLAAMGWLILGPYLGLFIPRGHDHGTLGDFFIVGIILFVSSLLAFLLTENMRSSLLQAFKEIENRKQLADQLQKNLHEKEDLLKEIHHRVKNNLTVINSLINMQGRHIQTKEQALKAFEEIKGRVYTMAHVHEKLYKSDNFSHISIKNYTEDLATHLVLLYAADKKINLNMEIDDIDLSIEQAIPCGMLINEIITNSLKHAFTGKKQGRIDIQINGSGEKLFALRIADSGPGFPDEVDIDAPETLGLKLIGLLTEQLQGKLTAGSKAGAEYHLVFQVT